MFSLKSWFNRQRPPADDELISAYIDGELDSAARTAFEARMASDLGLRRHVDTTRQLVETASRLPLASTPRNFTLPASMGKPSTPPTTYWRIGSAVAATVFVFTVGLDISGLLAPRTLAPAAAPQTAQSFAIQATSAPSLESPATTDTAAKSAPATGGAEPTETASESTPAPLIMGAGAGAGTGTVEASSGAQAAEPTATPPAANARQAASDTASVSSADEMTQVQRNAIVVEPSPSPEVSLVAVPPPAPAPEPPWLRILAGVALIAAVGAGIAGWARR